MIKSAILASVIPLLTAPIVLAGPYSDIPIGKPLDKRQTSSVRCTYAEWTFNSDGDTPCLVWAQVMNICSAGATVSPITTSTAPYRPPTGSSANECTCSVVSYNLMAGCSWCQPGILSSDWLSENQWKAGCSNYNDNGISVSTTGVNIPDWAFLPNDGDSWRSFAASAAAVAGPTGASNRTVTSTARPTSTRSSGGSGGGFSGSPSFDSGGTNIVAIAIGIVAGVYALIFLTVIITYCVRQKNRKAWYGPMAEYYRNGGQPAWAGAQPAGWTEAQGLLVSQDVPQPTGSPYPPSSTGHAPGGTNAYTPATSNVGLYQDVATSGTQYSQQPGGYPQQQTGGYPQPQAGGYPQQQQQPGGYPGAYGY